MDLGKESKFEVKCNDLHLIGRGRIASNNDVIPEGIDQNDWLWSKAKSIVVEIVEGHRIFNLQRLDSVSETFNYEPVDPGIYGIDAKGKMTRVGDVGDFDE